MVLMNNVFSCSDILTWCRTNEIMISGGNKRQNTIHRSKLMLETNIAVFCRTLVISAQYVTNWNRRGIYKVFKKIVPNLIFYTFSRESF